jgi:hypothetical protein
MLRISQTGVPQNACMGSALRIVATGNPAGGVGYAVYISSTGANQEAMTVAAGNVNIAEALTVGGKVTATGGIITLYSEATDLTAVPTNAEFDALLGANATAGTVAVIKDSGGTPVYLVVSDGADNWYVALTKAL